MHSYHFYGTSLNRVPSSTISDFAHSHTIGVVSISIFILFTSSFVVGWGSCVFRGRRSGGHAGYQTHCCIIKNNILFFFRCILKVLKKQTMDGQTDGLSDIALLQLFFAAKNYSTLFKLLSFLW